MKNKISVIAAIIGICFYLYFIQFNTENSVALIIDIFLILLGGLGCFLYCRGVFEAVLERANKEYINGAPAWLILAIAIVLLPVPFICTHTFGDFLSLLERYEYIKGYSIMITLIAELILMPTAFLIAWILSKTKFPLQLK